MWLSGARLVLRDGILERGSILIEDGTIAKIIEGRAPHGDGLPLAGLTLIPGLVDLHGDMIEKEVEPRPNAFFPVDIALLELDKRMAAAGITTAFAALSFWELEKMRIRTQAKAVELIDAIHALKDQLLVEFFIHARYEISTPVVAAALKGLIRKRQVHLVSLMDHTPGQGQFGTLESYCDFMSGWLSRPREAVVAEAQLQFQQAVELGEIWDVAREVAGLALEQGIPLASHDDDTPQKVALVASLGVTASEFPVTLEAARCARDRGMHVLMGAPNALRGISTSGNLSALEGIRAGVVDVLAADYHPGALIHAAFRLSELGTLPLHEAIKMVTLNPAKTARLDDRGCLEEGKRADIIILETAGRPRIRATLRQGRAVYSDHVIHRLGTFGRD